MMAVLLAPRTPHAARRTLTWSIDTNSWRFHLSISALLTNVRCTPSDLCMPEQSRHMKMPYVVDAHVGFLALQSKQVCAALTSS